MNRGPVGTRGVIEVNEGRLPCCLAQTPFGFPFSNCESELTPPPIFRHQDGRHTMSFGKHHAAEYDLRTSDDSEGICKVSHDGEKFSWPSI